MTKVDLSKYSNSWFNPGLKIKRALWYSVNTILFLTAIFPFSGVKIFILRMFGAKIGLGTNIKPRVNIKYPWFLTIGDNCWIGEGVWIDNLAEVVIGSNVCLSQGSMLLCGNHDYSKSTFDLMVSPIILNDGVWIGAQSIVCPGVKCGEHAVLSVKSVAITNLEPFTIYQGNPAMPKKKRLIEK